MSQKADCLLLGGDVYHSTEHSFPGLTPACQAAGLTVEYLCKGPALCAEKLEGKKVVIIFADGYTQDQPLRPTWMAPDQEQALEDFVKSGGSFMPIHNSMWGYPVGKHSVYEPEAQAAELKAVQELLQASTRPTTTAEVGLDDVSKMGPYRRLCGGVGGHHPAYELLTMTVVDGSHPITAGVTDFEVYDEPHFTFIDSHRGAQLLLKNRCSNGRESCAGWAFEVRSLLARYGISLYIPLFQSSTNSVCVPVQHGLGRVCYLAPGHVPLKTHDQLPPGFESAMSHPMCQRLFHNAVRWLARAAEPKI
jgi:hypothetical protein